MEAGAQLIQAAIERLPVSPPCFFFFFFFAVPTGYESTASLNGAQFHQSGGQAEKIPRGA